jgi:hypothetical protein
MMVLLVVPGIVVAVSIWLPLVSVGALAVVVGGFVSRIFSGAGCLESRLFSAADWPVPVAFGVGVVGGVPVAPVMSALLHLLLCAAQRQVTREVPSALSLDQQKFSPLGSFLWRQGKSLPPSYIL